MSFEPDQYAYLQSGDKEYLIRIQRVERNDSGDTQIFIEPVGKDFPASLSNIHLSPLLKQDVL